MSIKIRLRFVTHVEGARRSGAAADRLHSRAAVATELVRGWHAAVAARTYPRRGCDRRNGGARRRCNRRTRGARRRERFVFRRFLAAGSFLQLAQPITHGPTKLWQLARTEDEQHDDQDDDQVAWLKCTQSHNSRPPRCRCTKILGRCLLNIARQSDSDGEVRGSRHMHLDRAR
jgi:hypothetical protein